MTPRDLFAVALLVMGVWFLCHAAVSLLAIVIGPLVYLVVGLVFVFAAVAVRKRRSN